MCQRKRALTFEKEKRTVIAMNVLINIIINAIAVVVAAYVLPGVQVETFTIAIVVAILLSILNTFVKPILVFLTFPITILTLGLFIFVINALLILFVSNLVPGFKVHSFWSALLFSLILSLVSSFLHALAK